MPPREPSECAAAVLDGKRESGELLVRIEAPARLEILVQDVNGRPIAGADVSLEPRFEPLVTPRYGRLHDHAMFMGARPDIWSLFLAKTDARGRARFERVPTSASEGTYDVVVTAKDFARDWKDDVLVLASRDTNAVVVLEAIYRHRQAGKSPLHAALAGSKEVQAAVVCATLTSIIVFLPLVLGGRTEITTWLAEVGRTIIFTLVCSLFLSLTGRTLRD